MSSPTAPGRAQRAPLRPARRWHVRCSRRAPTATCPPSAVRPRARLQARERLRDPAGLRRMRARPPGARHDRPLHPRVATCRHPTPTPRRRRSRPTARPPRRRHRRDGARRRLPAGRARRRGRGRDGPRRLARAGRRRARGGRARAARARRGRATIDAVIGPARGPAATRSARRCTRRFAGTGVAAGRRHRPAARSRAISCVAAGVAEVTDVEAVHDLRRALLLHTAANARVAGRQAGVAWLS